METGSDYIIMDDRHEDRFIVVKRDDTEQLLFPYRWDGRYILRYVSRDRPRATRETWDGQAWQVERMDQATFTAWADPLALIK